MHKLRLQLRDVIDNNKEASAKFESEAHKLDEDIKLRKEQEAKVRQQTSRIGASRFLRSREDAALTRVNLFVRWQASRDLQQLEGEVSTLRENIAQLEREQRRLRQELRDL